MTVERNSSSVFALFWFPFNILFRGLSGSENEHRKYRVDGRSTRFLAAVDAS